MNIDFFEGTGYAEGIATTLSIALNVVSNNGKEVVYDFATMERGVYDYDHTPLFDPNLFPPLVGFTSAGLEGARMIYDVQLKGFNSERSWDEEYKGYLLGHTIGLGSPVKINKIPGTDKMSAGIGKLYVQSSEVYGSGDYSVGALGVSPIPILAASLSATFSELRPGTYYNYGAAGFISEQTIEQIKNDIRSGVDSPWPPGTATYTRQRAINELDEIWEKHKDYFRFRYRGYH